MVLHHSPDSSTKTAVSKIQQLLLDPPLLFTQTFSNQPFHSHEQTCSLNIPSPPRSWHKTFMKMPISLDLQPRHWRLEGFKQQPQPQHHRLTFPPLIWSLDNFPRDHFLDTRAALKATWSFWEALFSRV